jgi:HEAT repeat protein
MMNLLAKGRLTAYLLRSSNATTKQETTSTSTARINHSKAKRLSGLILDVFFPLSLAHVSSCPACRRAALENLMILEDLGIEQPPEWEREFVREEVEQQFPEEHRAAVLAELARIRDRFVVGMDSSRIDPEDFVGFAVRVQLEAVWKSAGDPAFFTEKRYMQSDELDRDALYALDFVIRDRQLMAKDIASLIAMVNVPATRLEALSTLERKGAEAAAAVPLLLRMLREGDQLECCKALQTLRGIGPAAQDAIPAIIDLANDPDYLIRRQAQLALGAIAPERAAQLVATPIYTFRDKSSGP